MKKAAVSIAIFLAALTTNAQWNITGNSNLSGSNFLGSTNQQDVIFKTASTERMRILDATPSSTAGFIGINTSSPTERLHVNGNIKALKLMVDTISATGPMEAGILKVGRITTLPGDSLIRFGDSTLNFSKSRNVIYVESTSGGQRGIGLGTDIYTRPYAPNSVAIGYRVVTQLSANNSVVIGSGTSTQNLINDVPYSLMVGFNSDKATLFVGNSYGAGNYGRVGIKTTDPKATLQLGTEFVLEDGGTKVIGRNLDASNGDKYIVNGPTAIMGFKSEGDIEFRTAAAGTAGNAISEWIPGMIIKNDGKIAMGTENTPGNYKLYVKGGIETEKVKVAKIENWADYVFDEQYQLLTLNEVNAYIKQNKHLPGIPSADEVKEQGVEMTEIVAKLLEKIEELTLYALEQQKQIDELRVKVK